MLERVDVCLTLQRDPQLDSKPCCVLGQVVSKEDRTETFFELVKLSQRPATNKLSKPLLDEVPVSYYDKR